jgi:electron transfer flavoprotein beta subunit
VILLTDRRTAGSDTLATSYLLKCAVETIGQRFGTFDLVFCGRQAIDGDTAQVGPQVAEKLALPQITYAEAIEEMDAGASEIVVRRALPLGIETVRCTLPCLLTVVGSANHPRPPSVRRMLACKLAATPLEYPELLRKWPEFETEQALAAYLAGRGLDIVTWSADDIGADVNRVGLAGSPTKVLKVEFVTLESSDSRSIDASPQGLGELVQDLAREYIL